MAPIATFVFLDLETTGLPREENNKTKITEISMVAMKRTHILETRPGALPRVQHKLTLCLYPRRFISDSCTDVTGLSNELLENEPTFNIDVFNLINTFLNILTKPVCLIAHNGYNFDFPIFKKHLNDLGLSLDEDLMCADSYHAFFDTIKLKEETEHHNHDNILEPKESVDTVDKEQKTDLIINEDKLAIEHSLEMKKLNETTPKRPIKYTRKDTTPKAITKVRRRFPWSQGEKPTMKFKLKQIYERLLNRPGLDAHRAESDCVMLAECAVAMSKEFILWSDENHCRFSEVKPMTIGERIDL